MNTRKVVLAGSLIVFVTVGGGWYTQSRASSSPTTHTYYIAADEVAWDYTPSGIDKVRGQAFDDVANMWVQSGPDRIGNVYLKALYREYTDATFNTLKPRPPEWEHLGYLGPLLRAQVGDTIKVVFKNNGRFPFSMHPHGAFYNKDSEGAPYDDGTPDAAKVDDGVPPGATHTYIWPVPKRAGPAEGQGSSAFWMYHSHTNEVKDVNAGLMGPIIVTARGATTEDGTPNDVDRELIVAFAEVDENLSWYIDDNIHSYAGDPASVKKEHFFFEPFYNSNLMVSLNGFVFGNTPVMTIQQGERVRWYIFSTTNFEVHAPHWHGNTVMTRNRNTDVLSLLTMDMFVADMVPDNPGTWLFHCHVAPHLEAGMQMLYAVTPEVEEVASETRGG